jgi:hypothetical protein
VKRYCYHCRAVRRLEQPPCQEGHGRDCDEWCCTVCGEAMLIASFVVRLERVKQIRAARQRNRRAA